MTDSDYGDELANSMINTLNNKNLFINNINKSNNNNQSIKTQINSRENNNISKNKITPNNDNSSLEKSFNSLNKSTTFKYNKDKNDFKPSYIDLKRIPQDKQPFFNDELFLSDIINSRIYKDKILNDNDYINLIKPGELNKYYKYYKKNHKFYNRNDYINKFIAFSNYNSYLAHCIIYPYFADTLFIYDDFYIDPKTGKLI